MLYSEHQERIAGKPPKGISYLDQVLLMHRKPSGEYVGKLKPYEHWYSRAHLKARRDGLLTAGPIKWAICGGPAEHFWFLTDKGKAAAEAAFARHCEYSTNLAAWGEKVQEARRLWQQSCPAEGK